MIDDAERRWLDEVYRPDLPQLTARAVLTGMVLGAVMCCSNLYIVLKTGWSVGVTVTACIVAYAFWATMRSLGAREFTILENNTMGSVASAAGYMTGGGNMAAIPALFMLTGLRPDAVSSMLWLAVIATLGVFTAIPIKRQLINKEQLAFPTGTATGETLRTLHAHGAEGKQKARLLGWSALIGVTITWLRDAKAWWMPFNIPSKISLPFTILGESAVKWTLAFEGSLLLVGAGALMSFKTGWSLLLGAVVTYGILAPIMVEHGAIASVTYKAIVQWSLWGGAAILLSSGLLSFAFQWRMIARSFSQLGQLFRARSVATDDPMDAVECPPSWFPLAYLVLGPVIVFLMWRLFGIPIWMGVLSLPLAVVMAMVASRVTGETDTTPTKALGPVTQAIYGAAVPGNLTANLMGANVTGGVGLHAADLLTDLKSAWMVGASPRKQLYGQLFGTIAGAAAVIPVFNLLIPDASMLGGEQFPAPSAQVWAGVSEVMVNGPSALHPTARITALVFGALGILLVLLERMLPRRGRAFVPSPSGIGISMIVPGYNSVSMFIGALVAEILRRTRPQLAERAVLPVASGFIAGESLMGILVAVLVAVGFLSR
ncbi:MAG TPA: OPT family oligopeptide transporter [Kofleriaceae bacterium]|nr:OPT family oligopeptide transporter [Kofleriaceae bacterium]